MNLLNKFGLSALHTACRFNVPGAIFDLLKHRDIDTNLRSSHGSTAVMVAVKYCSKEALEIIIRFVVTTSCCQTKYFLKDWSISLHDRMKKQKTNLIQSYLLTTG